MLYLGDFARGETVYCPWSTVGLSGGSITRGTNGTVAVWINGSTTQTTTGVTDTEDFDAFTGMHLAAIALSDAAYAAGSICKVGVTGMVVDGQTINMWIGYFTIGRGGIVAKGTLSGTHSSTTADLGANAPSQDISGNTVWFPGHNQTRFVDSYNTGTGVVTFSPSTAVTLADGDVWLLLATPPASTGAPVPANMTQAAGTAITASGGIPEVKVASIANNAMTAAAAAADLTTELQSGLATAASLATSDAKLDTLLGADVVYKKNVAVTGFSFYMRDTAGAAVTGATVNGFVSKDGGAFAALSTAAATEIGSTYGAYKNNITQTEMNADEILLVFTAPGAVPTRFKIRTQA